MNFHYHLLINPAAGSGNAAKKAQIIIDLLDEKNITYTPYYTNFAGEEKDIVNKIMPLLSTWEADTEYEVFHLLIIIGGDGTLHEVVNQFYLSAHDFPVSYIPAGSGNDFARGIGLSANPKVALEQILAAKAPQKINVLTYEEKINEEFGLVLNNVGIGLDALIVSTTNASTAKKVLNKYHLGSAAYLFSLVKAVFQQKPFPILVELNGHQETFQRTFLCTTTNIPYFGGGFAIAPMADPKKETIDLVIVERPSFPAILRFFIQLLMKKHTNNRHFKHFTSSKIRIVSVQPQEGQSDGEDMGKRSFDISFATSSQHIWYAEKEELN
ncbi:diacylglycerol/lipid kinase family protein [Enterococcus alishanensis]|uniref:YegS/Rv2252/BmrU family lipid kinase n=1 Tax=Enterococcus alishanensis TaxID=1303817 RepID=A0ABS6TF77_9ENTE|nr:YegS/Rv2252/BmrU family lipid kinase [Enterococcus alishanensis]MBV7391538.1 YegS/Rv2252/BmrU family lipid kinase [Enterococcus alishanensis]